MLQVPKERKERLSCEKKNNIYHYWQKDRKYTSRVCIKFKKKTMEKIKILVPGKVQRYREHSLFAHPNMPVYSTIMIPSIGTAKSEQTIITRTRLHPNEQSD